MSRVYRYIPMYGYGPFRPSGGALFSTLEFDAPLTSYLTEIKRNAIRAFTRATVATISDWENIIKSPISGEARFQGARRVENLNTTSVFADWSLLSATVTATGDSAPSGQSGTVYRVQGTASTDWYVRESLAVTAGNDYVQSFWVKSNTGSDQTFRINSGGKVSGNITATANWQRFSSQQTSTGGGATGLTRDSSQSAVDVLIYGPLSEEVTGQSNQNPSEYVSKGVGIGSEEVTNGTFDTDVSGWTAYDANASASWVAGEMDIDTTAINKGMYQTKTLISGHMYSFEGEVTLNSASQVKMGVGTGIGNFSMTTAKSVTSGSTGKISAVFRATQAAAWINIQIDTSGQDIRVDNVSVKSADHGANVDGVQYFDTQNPNTVSANVVNPAGAAATPLTTQDGVLIEEQRTNNCTYSADLSNAAWVDSNITKSTDGVTLPDGTAGTAETLTASAGNGTLLQTITLASATNDFSVYLQRKTGTGNIDITLDNGATWTTKALTGAGTWDRVDVTGAAAANPIVGIRIVTSTDAVQMWGAQLETGAFPTSYIPTTAAAETRNADVLTYDYQPPALVGSMVFTTTPIANDNTSYLLASNSGSIYSELDSATHQSDDGTSTIAYAALVDLTESKHGLTWKDSGNPEVATYSDGSQDNTGALDAGGYDPSTDELGIGCIGDAGTGQFNGTIKNVKFYTSARTQTQMEADTT